MVVYIPNAIYEQCKKKDENMEEFIKTVFMEWYKENFIHNRVVEKCIKSMCIIEDKFGT